MTKDLDKQESYGNIIQLVSSTRSSCAECGVKNLPICVCKQNDDEDDSEENLKTDNKEQESNHPSPPLLNTMENEQIQEIANMKSSEENENSNSMSCSM